MATYGDEGVALLDPSIYGGESVTLIEEIVYGGLGSQGGIDPTKHIYNRTLDVWSPISVGVGHPVTTIIPALRASERVREDLEDVEVTFDGAVIDRDIEVMSDDTLAISFSLVEPLVAEGVDERYQVHYGDRYLEGETIRPNGVLDSWPITIPHDSGSIAYTRPGDHWDDGVSTTVGARATLQFQGTKVRLLSDVGVDKGIVEVRVDSGEWTPVDLFSQDQQDDVEVYVIDVLGEPEDVHEFQLRVSAESNPLSSGSEVNVRSVQYRAPVTAVDQGEEISELAWISSSGGI